MRRPALAAASIALVALGACSSGDSYRPGPVPSTATTTTLEMTVRGVVASVSASARVVTLAQPVSGVSSLALTTTTEVRRSDGTATDLSGIAPGATVEAVGRPGAAGTLIARRLTVQ